MKRKLLLGIKTMVPPNLLSSNSIVKRDEADLLINEGFGKG